MPYFEVDKKQRGNLRTQEGCAFVLCVAWKEGKRYSKNITFSLGMFINLHLKH